MNGIQIAIARTTGLYDHVREIDAHLEAVMSQNALLERQIEDLDYIGLYEDNTVAEIISSANRKPTLQKLRRMRHENPIAKQSVKLILRFTLGKGIQYVITSEGGYRNQPTPIATAPDGGQLGQEPPRKPVNPFAKVTAEAIFPPPAPADQPLPVEPTQSQSADGNDEIKQIWEDFWTDGDNQLVFTSPKAMKKWFDTVITDGEFFFSIFPSSAAPYVKLSKVPTDEVTFTIRDPENGVRPVYYQRKYQPLKWNGVAGHYEPDGAPRTEYYRDWRITDEKLAEVRTKITFAPNDVVHDDVLMMHVAVNEVMLKIGERGISELYASREWFRVFKEFMEGRAAINQAATAISFKRKIKGGPTAVANLTGTLGGVPMGFDSQGTQQGVRKLTKPVSGAIYDSNEAADLEWMKTDTGAVNAEKDAHTLLMVGGAGVGINSHYYGEGGDANLATAQAMELPMVKSFEDWQDFVGDVCMDIAQLVLTQATDIDRAKQEIKRISFIFPPIITQDVVKATTAWTQIVASIAPGNHVVQEQAIRSVLSVMNVPNIDNLMPEIMGDMQRAEDEKRARQQAMLDAMNNAPVDGNNPADASGNGNGGPPARNGSSNAIDPRLKMVATGRGIPPAPNGRKPPR